MDGPAGFASRDTCIACRSSALKTVASGSYDDEPLHGFLERDPWGVSPMAALAGARWTLVECSACGTRFHASILDPAWRTHCFDAWMSGDAMEAFEHRQGAAASDSRFATASGWVGHVLSLEAMTREGRDGALRLLDFGCGSGAFLAHAALFGAEAYGIDASADRRAFAGGSGATILPGFADLTAGLRGTLDAATLFEVLEHLDDPLSILTELRQWVRPGGILVVETPDAGHVGGIATMADYRAIHPFDHINAFSPKTLTQIVERAGFRRVRRRLGYTTSGPVQTLRREVKRALGLVKALTTQQYFRAV